MAIVDTYLARHQDQERSYDADQAEFAALDRGSAVVDAGTFDNRLAGATDDFDPMDATTTQQWHVDDLVYDTAVGASRSEIERRAAMMGHNYPYKLAGGSIDHAPSASLFYEFLLSIAVAPSITKGEFVELPRTFERACAAVVATHFGTDTDHLHVGFPRDPTVGKSFHAAMKTAANVTGEWFWQPEIGLPPEPIHGDAGCDFIVWKRPPDGRRTAQLFVLGQCACGNDWPTKLHDLEVEEIGKWFGPLSYVLPVRSFATPFHITDVTLRETSRHAGYVFDRARLVMIGATAEGEAALKPFRSKFRALIDLVSVELTRSAA